MAERYSDLSENEKLILAINDLANSVDGVRDIVTNLNRNQLELSLLHSFQGQVEAQHNDRAATGTPGNNDYAGAQIIFGCYCQTCSYWRGKLA